jgi:hypothetical protein
MSGIPSDIAGSALGAGYQAREVARVRDAERAGEVSGAVRQTRALEESAESVDTSDDGTQVYSDSEGSGGMGRQLSEEETEDQTGNTESDHDTGPSPAHSLDIQA